LYSEAIVRGLTQSFGQARLILLGGILIGGLTFLMFYKPRH